MTGLEIPLTSKTALFLVVLVLTAFFAMFAPSLIAIGAIFVILAVGAYLLWVISIRVTDRLTGRRRKFVQKLPDEFDRRS